MMPITSSTTMLRLIHLSPPAIHFWGGVAARDPAMAARPFAKHPLTAAFLGEVEPFGKALYPWHPFEARRFLKGVEEGRLAVNKQDEAGSSRAQQALGGVVRDSSAGRLAEVAARVVRKKGGSLESIREILLSPIFPAIVQNARLRESIPESWELQDLQPLRASNERVVQQLMHNPGFERSVETLLGLIRRPERDDPFTLAAKAYLKMVIFIRPEATYERMIEAWPPLEDSEHRDGYALSNLYNCLLYGLMAMGEEMEVRYVAMRAFRKLMELHPYDSSMLGRFVDVKGSQVAWEKQGHLGTTE